MKKLVLTLSILLITLTGCSQPFSSDDRAPIDSFCGNRFEPVDLEPLPKEYFGITPTHAVRAEAYACVNDLWAPIGGLASVYINGTTPGQQVASGVVKTGKNTPWPYNNIAARLGFQFPIFIEPGIEVAVSAAFTSLLDKGEMLSCWMVYPDGREIPGTRAITVQTTGDHVTNADCIGILQG